MATSHEITCRLGLSYPPEKLRSLRLIRYNAPPSIDLRIPLLCDAITPDRNGPVWHPYFRPAPEPAPHGVTRSLPPFEHLGGHPEAIHPSLRDVPVSELEIETVPRA